MEGRIAQLKSFLEKTPADSFLQHALALEYSKSGQLSAARELFEGILQRDPQYIGSYYHLGKLLEQIGEPRLALHWYAAGMKAAGTAKDMHAYSELEGALNDLEDQQ